MTAVNFDGSSLGPLQQGGRLIGRKIVGRTAGDGDDLVGRFQTGSLGRAAVNHVHDQQGILGRLQFDAQPDEIAFDLRIEIVQLIGREEGRVFVESAGGSAGEFKDRAGRVEADAFLSEVGRGGDEVAGFIHVVDRAVVGQAVQLAAEIVDFLRRRLQMARGDERRLGQRDFEIKRAMIDDVLPIGLDDVVRLDFIEHLGIQIEGPILVELRQAAAEAAVGIAAAEIVVNPRQLDAGVQAGIGRVAAKGFFIKRQRFAPATLKLELLTADKDRRIDGSGSDRLCRGRRNGQQLRSDRGSTPAG